MRARLQSNPLLVQFNALSLQSNSLWQFLFRRKHFHWKDTTGDEYQREIRYTCTQICHNGKNSIQVRVQYHVIWGREHPNKKARRFIITNFRGNPFHFRGFIQRCTLCLSFVLKCDSLTRGLVPRSSSVASFSTSSPSSLSLSSSSSSSSSFRIGQNSLSD